MDEDVKKEFKAVYKRMMTQGNNISKIIGVEKDLFAKIEKLEREVEHLRSLGRNMAKDLEKIKTNDLPHIQQDINRLKNRVKKK